MKKLFTLFALLVAIVTGAWGEPTTIFSMTSVTGVSGTEGTDYTVTGDAGKQDYQVLAGEDATVVATFNQINEKSASATVHNGHGSTTMHVYEESGTISLVNSGGSYVKITLPEGQTIQEGDVISVSTASGTSIRISNTAGSNKGKVLTVPYTVDSSDEAELKGKNVIYFGKNSATITSLTAITITRPGEDDVNTPTIALDGSTLTLVCTTAGSSIRYTTDGTEPTASSTLYEGTVDLTNPCTVRAKAFKGANNEYSSEENSQDCYFTHSDALKVLNYSEGTLSSDSKKWTSKSNTNYTIVDNNEAEGRTIGSVTLSATNDGFKLNHTDSYTITVPSYVKITKIVVVGKSWLSAEGGNNAATMAFDGFTPASGSFYEYPTGGTTYVKALEFTPSEELEFGQSVTMRPGANQVGAYIEIYGEQQSFGITYNYNTEHGTISGPETAKPGETVTVTVTPDAGYELVDMHVYRASDNAGRDSYANPSVATLTFTMLSYNVKVGAEFMPILVDMPTESRTGYVVTKDGSEVEATTVNRSSSQMHGKKVYAIANGETVTLNVPAITNVARIVVSGVSSENQNSTITITGANEETASRTFAGRDNSIREAVLNPTTQTTTYTITSTTKGSWVQIKIYGEEAASETVTTNAGKWTSYTPVKNATLSAGAKAYIITSIDETNEKLVGNTVDVLKAGEGYFVKGAAANTDYTVTFTDDEATATDGNMLVGCVVSTALTNEGNTKYFLGTKDDTAGLYYVGSAGITIPAGKCYLQSTSTAQMNSLALPFDEATAINNVNANANSVAPVKVIKNGKLYIGNYNVAGQQVK